MDITAMPTDMKCGRKTMANIITRTQPRLQLLPDWAAAIIRPHGINNGRDLIQIAHH